MKIIISIYIQSRLPKYFSLISWAKKKYRFKKPPTSKNFLNNFLAIFLAIYIKKLL
jgi:hypothetical protein